MVGIKKKPLTIRLADEERKWLEEQAEKKGYSLGEYLREMIRERMKDK